MRLHYQSLNYVDGPPGSGMFRFTRTDGQRDGYIEESGHRGAEHKQIVMTRLQVLNLRDMLNEVLDDWQ